jgi:hypothetical protein
MELELQRIILRGHIQSKILPSPHLKTSPAHTNFPQSLSHSASSHWFLFYTWIPEPLSGDHGPLDWISLWGGGGFCPVYCRMFGSIPASTSWMPVVPPPQWDSWESLQGVQDHSWLKVWHWTQAVYWLSDRDLPVTSYVITFLWLSFPNLCYGWKDDICPTEAVTRVPLANLWLTVLSPLPIDQAPSGGCMCCALGLHSPLCFSYLHTGV